jgi:hypothetical protein
VEENDNNAIDLVCEILADLAIQYDCAVDLPHHTKKGMMTAGSSDSGRGASSMKDATRLNYTLTPMSEKEAKWYGISEKERRSLIRLDSGKVNIARPTTTPSWFRLVGVSLDNGDADYPSGDEVQTVEPWKPTSIWGSLAPVVLNQILDELDKDLVDGTRYSTEAKVSPTNSAWRVIKRHIAAATDDQTKEILKTWLASGLLYVKKYENPNNRKMQNGLWVDASRRPT